MGAIIASPAHLRCCGHRVLAFEIRVMYETITVTLALHSAAMESLSNILAR